jgi:hypothetical protein
MIKAKIDCNGWLELARGKSGELVPQHCPYDQGTGRCGHWCPFFWGPVFDKEKVSLGICRDVTFTFPSKDFLDERE